MSNYYEERPWGSFEVLADKEDYKVKRIRVKPLGRLSLQRHKYRAEHWYLVKGQGIVTLGEAEIPLKAGMNIDIPLGAIHRIKNDSNQAVLEFIEVQTGESFDEDDIERFEDDYKRV